MSCEVSDGQIVVRRRSLLDENIACSLRNQKDVVVADLKVVHVEKASHGFARRSIALAFPALVLLGRRSEHHVASNRLTLSINADVQ